MPMPSLWHIPSQPQVQIPQQLFGYGQQLPAYSGSSSAGIQTPSYGLLPLSPLPLSHGRLAFDDSYPPSNVMHDPFKLEAPVFIHPPDMNDQVPQMHNDIANIEPTPIVLPYFALAPLHYPPCLGAFIPEFTQPVLSKDGDVLLPPGVEDESLQDLVAGTANPEGDLTFRFYWGPNDQRGRKGKHGVKRVAQSHLLFDDKNNGHQRIIRSAKKEVTKHALNNTALSEGGDRVVLADTKLEGAAKKILGTALIILQATLLIPHSVKDAGPFHTSTVPGCLLLLLAGSIAPFMTYAVWQSFNTKFVAFPFTQNLLQSAKDVLLHGVGSTAIELVALSISVLIMSNIAGEDLTINNLITQTGTTSELTINDLITQNHVLSRTYSQQLIGQDESTSNDSAVSSTDDQRLMVLATTALADDETNVSRAPVLDPNLENMDLCPSRTKKELNTNISEGRIIDNEPDHTTEEEPVQGNTANTNKSVDVFYVHPMPAEEPPAYYNSSAAFPRVFSLTHHPIPMLSDVRGSRATKTDNNVPMLNIPDPTEVPTSGTIPYRGLSHADGKTSITFEGLTQSKAEAYLQTDTSQYNDYHSVYMPNIVHAIESYCFCQDELITNDWNIHLFRDGSYPGHPVISGGTKLSTGSPRSGCTWQEHVHEITDHHAHTRHLIHLIETVLSTRMLAEASNCAETIRYDSELHIKGGLTNQIYSGRYNDINLFFSESEAKCLNSYAAIAKAHREPELASKILDTLLMPFPDKDTINTLTESRLLNIGTVCEILHFAFDRDLVLRIAVTHQTCLVARTWLFM
ncbi:hypothetical protein EDB19DRAFT_1916168 [Suillus lakei]|nr:hypothetical protein EDB19DRAFT_1916168 [Suillus lakei]